MMKISFRTNKLEKICSQEKVMEKELGTEMSNKLKQRLMELKAATTLSDISYLPPARCHELKGDRNGQFSVNLKQPYRLIFIPVDSLSSQKIKGSMDKSQVTAIKIIEIVDTHKK